MNIFDCVYEERPDLLDAAPKPQRNIFDLVAPPPPPLQVIRGGRSLYGARGPAEPRRDFVVIRRRPS